MVLSATYTDQISKFVTMLMCFFSFDYSWRLWDLNQLKEVLHQVRRVEIAIQYLMKVLQFPVHYVPPPRSSITSYADVMTKVPWLLT